METDVSEKFDYRLLEYTVRVLLSFEMAKRSS
jgi:hypothetical protein